MILVSVFLANAAFSGSSSGKEQGCFEQMLEKASYCDVDTWDSDWSSGACEGLDLLKMKKWSRKDENRNKVPLVFERVKTCKKVMPAMDTTTPPTARK